MPPADGRPSSGNAPASFEIATPRLRLRPLEAGDLSAFVAYRSDPGVARYQSWDPSYAMVDAEALLAAQVKTTFGDPGGWVQLALVDGASGALCGDCAVRVVADQPSTAEVGITLAPAWQGRGVATEALQALVAALFDEHGRHRVFAQVDDRNVASSRLFERLGFRCEGRLIEADWFKESWTTMRLYAMLDREWHLRAARTDLPLRRSESRSAL
jgi:RimJ/RimL family protein N-acetyltransferase